VSKFLVVVFSCVVQFISSLTLVADVCFIHRCMLCGLSESRTALSGIRSKLHYDMGEEGVEEPSLLSFFDPLEKAGSDANSCLLLQVCFLPAAGVNCSRAVELICGNNVNVSSVAVDADWLTESC